jgi:predicted lipoprotein with Yx(FWY)xxD motif
LKQLIVGAAFVAAAAILVASASGQGGGAIVKVGPSNLGRVLVDAHGKTLYRWAHDKGSNSTCNGECAQYWPPLITRGQPTALAGANQKLVGTSRRSDGRLQVTYAGHPLYYFVKDTKAGQTNGEGLTGFGGRWDPVSSTGAAVRKGSSGSGSSYGTAPLTASIISPGPGDSAGVGGTFSVEVALQASSVNANGLLAGYTAAFNDPNAPTFHPGPNAAAPGLVVLLSTTPTIAGTPLQGPNTNLAGVFQINDVTQVKGLTHTFNSWIVTSAGFFGKGQAGDADRLRRQRHRSCRRNRHRAADLQRRPRDVHDRRLNSQPGGARVGPARQPTADRSVMTTTIASPTQPRELAHRVSGDIEVTLYWSADDNSTSVSILQPATEETITFVVERERALDAFHHPFFYLPHLD